MDEIEEIKRRIDIVELISGYLTLKKAGANYRALCPFHNEKTPSMMISPEKQIFKCFGCAEGGDVFSFIMKMENLEFREALELLAERAGVKLEHSRQQLKPGERPDKKTRLFKINALSAQFFQKVLLEHAAGQVARDYLKGRGLTKETIEEFQLGYAPSNAILSEILKKKGFAANEVYDAGGPDRFFRRIIFPIRDVMGNTIGFTGRVMDPKQEPKYLNTPETPIFHKGRILYNLDKARGEIKLAKTTILVEGQMDVISSWQAGVKNVVATSGTALTDEHLRILYRYTPNVTFAFDSDNAGLISAKKAYEMAILEGMNVRMVNLEDYKDPGEVAAENPGLWQDKVSQAQPVIDWYFRLAFKGIGKDLNDQYELTSQEKKEIAKELLPIIKKIPDPIEQAHYVGILAKKIDIPEQVIFDTLNKVQSAIVKDKKTPDLHEEKISTVATLIGLVIHEPKLFAEISSWKEDELEDPLLSKLYKAIFSWYNDNKSGKHEEKLEKYLLDKLPDLAQQIELLVLGVEERFLQDNDVTTEQIFTSVLEKFREEKSEQIKKYYAVAINQAERQGDISKLKQLMKEFQDAISTK